MFNVLYHTLFYLERSACLLCIFLLMMCLDFIIPWCYICVHYIYTSMHEVKNDFTTIKRPPHTSKVLVFTSWQKCVKYCYYAQGPETLTKHNTYKWLWVPQYNLIQAIYFVEKLHLLKLIGGWSGSSTWYFGINREHPFLTTFLEMLIVFN